MVHTKIKSSPIQFKKQVPANKNKETPKSKPRARAKKAKKAAVAAKARNKFSTAVTPSTPPQDTSSATTPSTPMKGISKVVNDETVTYIVSSGGNEVRIYSGSCKALAMAERNRSFEEALKQIPMHPSYSITRFQDLM